MKQAWSSFSLPTPFAPTVSLDDLDKRIADLHAVEQWLALNQAMLRNTIQGLEIQRAALAAVQDFAAGIDAGQKPVDERFAQSMAHVAAAAAEQAERARRARESRIDPARSGDDAPDDDASNDTASTAQRVDRAPRSTEARTQDAATRSASGGTAADESAGTAAGTAAGASAGMPAGIPAVNALAWWNTLQSGFRDIAAAAMQSSALPPGGTPSPGMPFWPTPAVSKESGDAGPAQDASGKAARSSRKDKEKDKDRSRPGKPSKRAGGRS
ncbi:MAG: PhaM family polyhydroxyalkanoate granule multifunctional regulatory protein [Lautropia sp.]